MANRFEPVRVGADDDAWGVVDLEEPSDYTGHPAKTVIVCWATSEGHARKIAATLSAGAPTYDKTPTWEQTVAVAHPSPPDEITERPRRFVSYLYIAHDQEKPEWGYHLRMGDLDVDDEDVSIISVLDKERGTIR